MSSESSESTSAAPDSVGYWRSIWPAANKHEKHLLSHGTWNCISPKQFQKINTNKQVMSVQRLRNTPANIFTAVTKCCVWYFCLSNMCSNQSDYYFTSKFIFFFFQIQMTITPEPFAQSVKFKWHRKTEILTADSITNRKELF